MGPSDRRLFTGWLGSSLYFPRRASSLLGLKCVLMDLNFTSPATWPTATAALGACKASVATAFTLDSALTQSQRALAAQVDLCGWKQELEAASLTRKAVLLSEAEPGGRTFLAAVPAGPKRMEPAVILAELRHRL